MTDDRIFIIKARRCLRCGRLLTSEQALKTGFGCDCARKVKKEELERQPIPGQITVDEWIQNTETEGDYEERTNAGGTD